MPILLAMISILLKFFCLGINKKRLNFLESLKMRKGDKISVFVINSPFESCLHHSTLSISLFFCLYILPILALKVNTWGMDIKKTWEKHPCLSHSLAFALPFTKISNSASPRQSCIICLSMQRKLSSFGGGYNRGIRV